MGEEKDARAHAAWAIATRVVGLLRWDREEQQAEAFVEILLVADEELERLAAARRFTFRSAVADPGRN